MLLVLPLAGTAQADPATSGTTEAGDDFHLAITDPGDHTILPHGTTSASLGGQAGATDSPAVNMNVSFLLDDSGSISPVEWAREKGALRALINQLAPAYGTTLHANLITFSTAIRTILPHQPLNAPIFYSALDSLVQSRGGTETALGLRRAIDLLAPTEGPKQIVLITDGLHTGTHPQTLASELRGRDIGVSSFAIGSSATCTALRTIGSCTVVTSFENLGAALVAAAPEGIASVEVSLNGGSYGPVDSLTLLGAWTHQVSGLVPGWNEIVVKAVTDSGLELLADISLGVKAEAPPETQVNGPVGPVPPGSVTFDYTGTSTLPIAGFECALDGAAFAPCALGSSTVEVTTHGDHTFAVRAVDDLGTVDPTPASWDFSVGRVSDLDVVGINRPAGNTQWTQVQARATLTDAESGVPLAGESIVFTTQDGAQICAATTNPAGVAKCNGRVSSAQLAADGGYLATFAGNATNSPVTELGALTMRGKHQ